MSKEITVFLVYADWCGHCTNFKPIYEQAEKGHPSLIKKLNLTGLDNIVFDKFNLGNDDSGAQPFNYSADKKRFMSLHKEQENNISGYPTVMLCVKQSNNKGDTLSKYEIVNVSNQVEEFIKNIHHALQTLNSTPKILFTFPQKGGSALNYQAKYLKYKTKYLKLANK